MGCGVTYTKDEIYDYLKTFVKYLNLNKNSIEQIINLKISNRNTLDFNIINYIYINSYLHNHINTYKFPDYKFFLNRYFRKIIENNIFGIDELLVILIVFTNNKENERENLFKTLNIHFDEKIFRNELMFFEFFKKILYNIIVLPIEVIFFITLDENFKNEIKHIIEVDYNKEKFEVYCLNQFKILTFNELLNNNLELLLEKVSKLRIENLIKEYI